MYALNERKKIEKKNKLKKSKGIRDRKKNIQVQFRVFLETLRRKIIVKKKKETMKRKPVKKEKR